MKRKTANAREQRSPANIANGGQNLLAPAAGRNRIACMPFSTEKVVRVAFQ